MKVNRCFLKHSLYNDLFFSIGVFSTMPIITIYGFTMFTILVYVILMLFFFQKKTNIIIYDNYFINVIIFAFATTSIMLIRAQLPMIWRIESVKSIVNNISIFLLVSIIAKYKDEGFLEITIKGLRMSCYIQMIWVFMQIIFIELFGFDLNGVIFGYYNAEKSTVGFQAKGLCWHASNLTVVIILLYLFSKSHYMKFLSLITAFFASNTTVRICIIICFLMDCFFRILVLNLRNTKVSIKKILAVLIISIICVFFLRTYLYYAIINIFERIMHAFGNDYSYLDISARVHASYYSNIFAVLSRSNTLTILFGYGWGCSGYPFSLYYNQYSEMHNWVVESDYINIILSRGIIGFFTYYIYLVSLCIKGNSVDKKYLIFFSAIFIGGFFYNIQFLWVIMVILLISLCIYYKKDFFNYIS